MFCLVSTASLDTKEPESMILFSQKHMCDRLNSVHVWMPMVVLKGSHRYAQFWPLFDIIVTHEGFKSTRVLKVAHIDSLNQSLLCGDLKMWLKVRCKISKAPQNLGWHLSWKSTGTPSTMTQLPNYSLKMWSSIGSVYIETKICPRGICFCWWMKSPTCRLV